VSRPPAETPREILDRRVASGEIDLETYDRLREKLAASGTGQ
jgi:putative membrane protein